MDADKPRLRKKRGILYMVIFFTGLVFLLFSQSFFGRIFTGYPTKGGARHHA